MRTAVLLCLALCVNGCGPSAEDFRLDGASAEACAASLSEAGSGGDSARVVRAAEAIYAEAGRRAYRSGGTADDARAEMAAVCADLDGATLDEILIRLD